MKNDPDSHERPLPEDADGEVERLLRDAYDAPALPRSLYQRLDRVITREWGQSADLGLAQGTTLQRSLSAGTRWVKAVRLTVCVAVVACACVDVRPRIAGVWMVRRHPRARTTGDRAGRRSGRETLAFTVRRPRERT